MLRIQSLLSLLVLLFWHVMVRHSDVVCFCRFDICDIVITLQNSNVTVVTVRRAEYRAVIDIEYQLRKECVTSYTGLMNMLIFSFYMHTICDPCAEICDLGCKLCAGLSNNFIQQRSVSVCVYCCRDLAVYANRWWFSLFAVWSVSLQHRLHGIRGWLGFNFLALSIVLYFCSLLLCEALWAACSAWKVLYK